MQAMLLSVWVRTGYWLHPEAAPGLDIQAASLSEVGQWLQRHHPNAGPDLLAEARSGRAVSPAPWPSLSATGCCSILMSLLLLLCVLAESFIMHLQPCCSMFCQEMHGLLEFLAGPVASAHLPPVSIMLSLT